MGNKHGTPENIAPGAPHHHHLTDEDRAKGRAVRRLNYRRKVAFREALLEVIHSPVVDEEKIKILKDNGIDDPEKFTRLYLGLVKMVEGFASGDPKMTSLIMEALGAKTIRNENLNVEMRPLVDLRVPNGEKEADGNHDGASED